MWWDVFLNLFQLINHQADRCLHDFLIFLYFIIGENMVHVVVEGRPMNYSTQLCGDVVTTRGQCTPLLYACS